MPILLCVGPSPGNRLGFDGDPSQFHEMLCRLSYKLTPTNGTGAGSVAERALFNGGTLMNRKLEVHVLKSHGMYLRELVAAVDFAEGEVVSCYGGWARPAPPEGAEHTHMRHIALSDYVLDGEEFSNAFPAAQQSPSAWGEYDISYSTPMAPCLEDVRWSRVIVGTGIGYMANTVTKCLLHRRQRPNVIVDDAIVGRRIPGVPYSSIVFLKSAQGGIRAREPVISPYEAWKGTKKFTFHCSDRDHHAAAGSVMESSDEEHSDASGSSDEENSDESD